MIEEAQPFSESSTLSLMEVKLRGDLSALKAQYERLFATANTLEAERNTLLEVVRILGGREQLNTSVHEKPV